MNSVSGGKSGKGCRLSQTMAICFCAALFVVGALPASGFGPPSSPGDAANQAGNAAGNAANQAGNAAGNAANQGGNAANNAANQAGNAANDAANQAGNAANQAANAAGNAANQARNAANNAAGQAGNYGQSVANQGAAAAGYAASRTGNLASGQACISSSQCRSGFCVAGVCSATASNSSQKPTTANAPSRTTTKYKVRGVVKNSKGQAIERASVALWGTSVQTAAGGTFELTVNGGNGAMVSASKGTCTGSSNAINVTGDTNAGIITLKYSGPPRKCNGPCPEVCL